MKHIKKQRTASLVEDHRDEERFDSELPLLVDSSHGVSRNISATGIYFETEAAQEPGSHVHLVIEVNVQGQKLKLVCEGEIVRVDHHQGMVGVAAKLANSFFSETAVIIGADASNSGKRV
ncbi:MAG: PilZ domain-containing protein [Pseudomonadota bacterium]